MANLLNLVRQGTTTTGTGTIDLDGSAVDGHRTWGAVATTDTSYRYAISDGSNYEIGEGTFTSGTPNTLSRDTIVASSNSGSAISLSGDAEVYCDALAEDIPVVTNATLTKSFTSGETSTIALSQAITAGAPVVSVTKEVPQTGVTSSGWDVATSGANYERHDTAYATTLTPSNATGDGTFTLGTGSFASEDVGKTIEGNGGEAILTATDGSYRLVTSFNDTSAIASGDWSMYAAVFDATNGLELSGISKFYDIEIASYDDVSFNFESETSADGKDHVFNDDGTKLFRIVRGFPGSAVYAYDLSTPFDISTITYSNDSLDVENDINDYVTSIAFGDGGSKMYIGEFLNDEIYEYSLSTPFDISTANFLDNSYQPGDGHRHIVFYNEGNNLLSVGGSSTIRQHSLTTPFDLTSASYDEISFDISQSSEYDGGFLTNITLSEDGSRIHVISGDVYQIDMSSQFDISTASYNGVKFDVNSQEEDANGLTFDNTGKKMYISGPDTQSIYQYTTGEVQPTAQYTPAVTNAGGQIDSTYWTGINSMTTDQVAGDGQVYYAVSTDGRTTWSVIDDTDGVRPIVRDNAGTWEVNDNGTYTGVTWVSAADNTELDALQEALSVAANRMDKTQLEAVTDANHYTLDDSLDLMIALYLGSSSSSIPSSDGVSINYDAPVKNEGAILGTDYDWDFPANDVVRITSNATNNLKVRIV